MNDNLSRWYSLLTILVWENKTTHSELSKKKKRFTSQEPQKPRLSDSSLIYFLGYIFYHWHPCQMAPGPSLCQSSPINFRCTTQNAAYSRIEWVAILGHSSIRPLIDFLVVVTACPGLESIPFTWQSFNIWGKLSL